MSRQFEKFSMVSCDIRVEVQRNGTVKQIPVIDIVMGDVVCLRSGDQVPAGLLVKGQSLVVDEASMTGESAHVEVNLDENPFLLSGTKVDEQEISVFSRAVETFADALSTIIVVIPEGLPFAVTLALYDSLKRMVADQALVRKMSTCQPDQMEFFHQRIGLNTSGSVYKPNSGSEFEFSGSPTEKALLSWGVLELKMDIESLKRTSKLLHVEEFNSKKKRSRILMKKNGDNTMHMHRKGAEEMTIAMCTHYYDSLGMIKAIDDSEREEFNQLVEGMAASSLRCIAFAHTEVSKQLP
ncbi:hypothetical protein ACET3Z_029564 [Daucus carota]